MRHIDSSDYYALLIHGFIDLLEPMKDTISSEDVYRAYLHLYRDGKNQYMIKWIESLEQMKEFIHPEGYVDINYLENELYYMDKD